MRNFKPILQFFIPNSSLSTVYVTFRANSE